jgi:hypothetical protein
LGSSDRKDEETLESLQRNERDWMKDFFDIFEDWNDNCWVGICRLTDCSMRDAQIKDAYRIEGYDIDHWTPLANLWNQCQKCIFYKLKLSFLGEENFFI